MPPPINVILCFLIFCVIHKKGFQKEALKIGSPTWARTRDTRINSPLLYRLSYWGIIESRILTQAIQNFLVFKATSFEVHPVFLRKL